MDNETSFQSFPAHQHNLLSVTLDGLGWYIHPKVYPKLKTRYNISAAMEVFSKWFVQFESRGTDIILLVHSLREILGAEVLLLRNEGWGFIHRILGVDYYDGPLWGMHLGVTSAGLGDLFGKSPSEEDDSAAGGGVCWGKFEYGFAVNSSFWQDGGSVLWPKDQPELHDCAE